MKFKGRIVWEKGYPYILTVILLVGISIFSCIDFLGDLRTENGVLIINAINLKLFSDSFLNCVLTVESIIFGFLLAVLALTVQSNSISIRELRKSNRFNELIVYNKHAVICAFWTIILTTILLLVGEYLEGYVCTILKYIWGGFSILNLFLTYRFLDIFYVLSKE